jgi:acyl-CoA thioesterase-1
MANGSPTNRAPYGRLPLFLASLAILCAAVFCGEISAAHAGAHTGAYAGPVRIVAFGDSLTAGYGLPREDAFPAKLAKALKAKGYDVRIANAGVSGDTTAAGLARLDWSVPKDAEAVILELGANDAFRGIAPAIARKNLDEIITRLRARHVEVLLAGMYAPRNLGREYVAAFDRMYRDLAGKHGLILVPFFLDGVAGRRGLNQPDGLHPTSEGVDIIVERILPSVEALIRRVRARKPS